MDNISRGASGKIAAGSWSRLLSGHWRAGRPTTPGWYFTATLDGSFSGLRRWRRTLDGHWIDDQAPMGDPDYWKGYVWSVPIPDPPRRPPKPGSESVPVPLTKDWILSCDWIDMELGDPLLARMILWAEAKGVGWEDALARVASLVEHWHD